MPSNCARDFQNYVIKMLDYSGTKNQGLAHDKYEAKRKEAKEKRALKKANRKRSTVKKAKPDPYPIMKRTCK